MIVEVLSLLNNLSAISEQISSTHTDTAILDNTLPSLSLLAMLDLFKG